MSTFPFQNEEHREAFRARMGDWAVRFLDLLGATRWVFAVLLIVVLVSLVIA